MLTKFWFALHVTYDESLSEDPRGAPRPGGSEGPATLAVYRGIFLGAPRPVEGHRRHLPPWPSIISYPVDTITHICSIVNSGSTCRLMILTIFLNDNIQKTAATIS